MADRILLRDGMVLTCSGGPGRAAVSARRPRRGRPDRRGVAGAPRPRPRFGAGRRPERRDGDPRVERRAHPHQLAAGLRLRSRRGGRLRARAPHPRRGRGGADLPRERLHPPGRRRRPAGRRRRPGQGLHRPGAPARAADRAERAHGHRARRARCGRRTDGRGGRREDRCATRSPASATPGSGRSSSSSPGTASCRSSPPRTPT